jgi:D-Tyr-tRNAtyr deacylase
MPKKLVPFNFDEIRLSALDKLILVSQFGWSHTRYPSRTAFLQAAIQAEAKRLYAELTADLELRGLTNRLMHGEDVTWLE